MRYRKIVLDTETTGIHPEDCDELLQVSIVNADDGLVIFNELICPQLVTSWDDAAEINHITPDMVDGKPHITAFLDELQSILDETKIIIGYNTAFDLAFLSSAGVDVDRGRKDGQYIVDVMRCFANRYGQWDDVKQRRRWCKLSEAASYIGYRPTGKYHDSVEDCRATLAIYKALRDRAIYELVIYKNGRISSHETYDHYEMAYRMLDDFVASYRLIDAEQEYEAEVYRIIDGKRSIVLMWPQVPF